MRDDRTRGSPTEVHCRLQRQLPGIVLREDRTLADVRSARHGVDVRTGTIIGGTDASLLLRWMANDD